MMLFIIEIEYFDYQIIVNLNFRTVFNVTLQFTLVIELMLITHS